MSLATLLENNFYSHCEEEETQTPDEDSLVIFHGCLYRMPPLKEKVKLFDTYEDRLSRDRNRREL
jgi:hypothetical protein